MSANREEAVDTRYTPLTSVDISSLAWKPFREVRNFLDARSPIIDPQHAAEMAARGGLPIIIMPHVEPSVIGVHSFSTAHTRLLSDIKEAAKLRIDELADSAPTPEDENWRKRTINADVDKVKMRPRSGNWKLEYLSGDVFSVVSRHRLGPAYLCLPFAHQSSRLFAALPSHSG